MNITVSLVGTAPLLVHNPQMVDPQFEINRQIALLTSKRKKTDEDYRQIEDLEWLGGIYTMPTENGAVVCEPTSKARKCCIEAARMSKQGKQVERALSFKSLMVPLVYEGPKDVQQLWKDPAFRSRLSVTIGQKRVMRVRPQFFPWALTIPGIFIEDAGLNFDELQNIVEMAGVAIGIGDNRVNGYGRFEGTVKRG